MEHGLYVMFEFILVFLVKIPKLGWKKWIFIFVSHKGETVIKYHRTDIDMRRQKRCRIYEMNEQYSLKPKQIA